MSCKIEDISTDMCNKICNDNISASNTVQLSSCKTRCEEKIIDELNPLDITNNFIFLKSANVAEDALEVAGAQSQELYDKKKELMNELITNMEAEIQIHDADCGIRIGVKWIKIIDGDKNNEFKDVNYINKFKKYSAFGLKWKNVGTTEPDSKYIKLLKDTTISDDSYDYLQNALLNGKNADNNIILNKKALIDNNLLPDDSSTDDLKIYPNSYIKLLDNTYCVVYSYPIDENLEFIFNSRDDDIDLTLNEDFENAFFDLTMDDFTMNNSGDIYIPTIGCSDFNTVSCNDIENLLHENENCMVNNKDNDYIKRKDTIPYLFHNDTGTNCTNKALNFDNKNELFDIINLISNDQTINHELNEMMGIYEPDRYDTIKNRINEILTDAYSQYFSTNDFLNLFDNNIQYWITIDDPLFTDRSYFYDKPNTSTGKLEKKETGFYDVNDKKTPTSYDKIAKILSNYTPDSPSSNYLIQLTDTDVEMIRTLFRTENKEIENILKEQDYFIIKDDNYTLHKVILYVPLYEHIDNRESIYHHSHLNSSWSSKSGVDFYEHLNNGEKKIENTIIPNYGIIGNDVGFYNNVILSDDYITQSECDAIILNAENTSNTIFLMDNIENRHNLDDYKLNDNDFTDLDNEFYNYETNITNLNNCLEKSKTMINLDTYTKTKEYDIINDNIGTNAEINNKYNIYLSKVNKYEGRETPCKLLSEFNNINTCGTQNEGQSIQMCLSNDLVSDIEYEQKLHQKKEYLETYIFDTQKNYYVGKNTIIDEPYNWRITTEYPDIGLELVNDNLTTLLDNKFNDASNIITLTSDDLLSIQIDSNIDNNTYVTSSVSGRYYIVNLEQEICNQPDDYELQNSDSICGGNKYCAYENEYNNSISEISHYDDNLCKDKYDYLDDCYNQEPALSMGQKIDYSVCKDDTPSSPRIIDCPQTEDPECPSDSYITYKIENSIYTCEKECGSCVSNTTLNSDYSKCHANIGYYYDYNELETTTQQQANKCDDGYFIDFTGALSKSECKECIQGCDDYHYETVSCTFSTNRVCTPLPNNSTKNQNGFVCDENYFKSGDQCVACPNETTSEQGSESVSRCIANDGHYFDYKTSPIPTVAPQCDEGTYCASGAISETECPNNTTSPAGSSDISQCYALPGFYTVDNEAQSCLAGHYCPGGSTIPIPCPANTYNSLPQKTDVSDCNPCEYETTSEQGSEVCTACPELSYSVGKNFPNYYNYQISGCNEMMYECPAIESSESTTHCPDTSDGSKQFYGYTGSIERDPQTNKPLLVLVDSGTTETQEEITEKLSNKTVYQNYTYNIGEEVEFNCEKSCVTCNSNQRYINTLNSCMDCGDYKVTNSNGTECITCTEKERNSVYDENNKNCKKCEAHYIANSETRSCDKPEPGYIVKCGNSACTDATLDEDRTQELVRNNSIVLGQINKVAWDENIKSIIFDYETDNINLNIDEIVISFKNNSSTYQLPLIKKQTVADNKYYSDISKNIIIFENTTLNEDVRFIKFMEGIYIDSSISSRNLPGKLILQTKNDSYYLLTHRMKNDITHRYSEGTGPSYFIFHMDLNITNEEYLCPDNTYVSEEYGVNMNICKFYDVGYYRDVDTNSSKNKQTNCFKDFTEENKAKIDITESILGAESGEERAGCIYKCKTEGHYYNEGTPGEADNRCEQCPIGYKCDDFQNRTACNGTNEYQNETRQTVCKTIPDGGSAILDDEGKANIGFSVPAGKKYSSVSNTITHCSVDTYKNMTSDINYQDIERDIECISCPENTTTKGQEGSTELAQCIPNFGYTLDISNREVTTLEGYDETSTGSIQCASGYYLGDFDGACNTNPNECTQCEGDNDKACIECPTGYNCAGGSVDCKIDPAIPIIKDGNIDTDPLDGNHIYTIDSCWPGMKLINGGECQPCDYTSGGSETGQYCFDGTPIDHISASTDDIKLKNNDNFTPAIYITAADNENYNINSIAQNSEDHNDIVFTFKNNYIPAYIDAYLEEDIESLKDTGLPLYLYEHASGERIGDEILNAKNVTQEVGVSIRNNTINLLNEGYISNIDASNYNIIRNKIRSNNLKFTGIEKNQLIDIIKQYKKDKYGEIIDEDMNLSYVYDLQYYDGTQNKIYTYVYRILPYPSQCPEGYETTTGLIDSCQLCPQGTYKADSSATQCLSATGNNYVGVHDLIPSNSATGLGGIKVSTIPPSDGFEMLTTSGGNYGYKLRAGYGYTAAKGGVPFDNSECGKTSFNNEQILINNTEDNTSEDYLCTSCPPVASLDDNEQIGLVRLETDSLTATTSRACVIKVCDTNYTNIDGDNTNFCELETCLAGHYFNGISNSCEICPVGHYCDGGPARSDGASKVECPVDTYNDITGISLETDCQVCPLNTSTNTLLGQTTLGNCFANPGYFFDSNDQSYSDAIACPAGTYNPIPNTTSVDSCIKCPQDTYSSNTANKLMSDCLDCPDNSSTRYGNDGNIKTLEETKGKTRLNDCKPLKMYERNPSNTTNDPSNEIILKPGHANSETGYSCNGGYYFNNVSRECELCPTGHYCPGGPAESVSAIKEVCPDFSTSTAGRSRIDECSAMSGYEKVGNDFVAKDGVKTDASGVVVFKEGSTLVQCEPGYEGKTYFDLECQPCVDRSTFSTDGDGCSPCGTSSDTELVIRQCDTKNNIKKINKSILRIHSIETDNIVTALENSNTITAQQLYDTYINQQTGTDPNYSYLLPNPSKLYFIKLPITYSNLPVVYDDATANIHSNVIDSDIIDNVIDSSTSSYDKIIEFIDTITSATYILDLCYFWNNGENWEVFLLLPKCGCIPGTYGDNCDSCQIDTGTSRQTFQPGYNQEECIHVPTNIQNGSYTIIQDPSSIYNIGVELNAGWAMDSSGISYVCAEDTYNASTTDITQDIVIGPYTEINCVDCPTGSGTQDRDQVTGATTISDCTVKFGYTETSPATTPATYEYGTGYDDVDADDTIDCKAGYYFNGTSCVECPTGHYCTGGIAKSGIAGRAEQTPCPIGTYNSNVRSINENDCNLINKDTYGRGFYGTEEGIDNSTHTSFVQCPENTRINKQATTRTTDDCIAENGWEKTPTSSGNDAYAVTLKSRYYIDQTTQQPVCLPGTVSSSGECIDYSGDLSYHYDELQRGLNADNYYLSGKSNIPELCTLKPEPSAGAPNSNHDLSKCDAYKDAYVVDMSSANVVHVSDEYIKCVTGYELIEYEFLDTFNDDPSISDPEKAKIDNANEFYLYEYGSIYMNDMSSASVFWTVSDNYHLNTDPNVVSILKNAVEVDFKVTAGNRITANDLGYIQAIIKSYKKIRENLTDMQKVGYMLMFYNDVNVYNSSGPVTIRYIYKILNGCGQCSSGYTSDGYSCYLNECQSGEFYNGTSCQDCPVGYYCPAGQTQISEEASGNWLPARTQCAIKTYKSTVGAGDCISCPSNTTSPVASTNANDCVPDAGYYGAAGGTATACGNGTYKSTVGAGDCISCPSNTTSPVASTNANDCVPNAGYYGAAGGTATACPGVTSESDPVFHKISTLQSATEVNDCTYQECVEGFYRDNTGQCTLMNDKTIDECESNQIFVPGKRSGGGTSYSAYDPEDISNYSVPTIYGHDNMCISFADIPLNLYDTCCPKGYQQSTVDDKCILISGYYGQAGGQATACPGVTSESDPVFHKISTLQSATEVNHCTYEECDEGYYRDNTGQCTLMNYKTFDECESNQIFVPGKRSGGGTSYSAYELEDISNYSVPTIYGHDNMCIPYSEICT